MSHEFATPRFPGHCACCDTRLLGLNGEDLGYRRVHFWLNNESETFVSFCPLCADHEWTPERLDALTDQCQEGWIRSGWEPGATIRFLKPLDRPVQSWAEVQ